MTRTAANGPSVGTEAEGRSAQNHSPVDRQVGEAVAWRFKFASSPSWSYRDEPPSKDWADQCRNTQPLIPASDLEQVTRERDEAVRLLRQVVGQTTSYEQDERDAQAFLASLRSMEKTGGERQE